MDQVGFDATARNPHPFFNHAAPTIREMPSQNTSPANTTTANTTADNTTAANPTPDGLAAKDAIHIDAATVARPVLKVSDVLTTLHKAFRSGDSAVEKFVDAIVADPAIANENNSDNPRASSRQNDNGLRLMAAEYQAMRRVDKTLAFSLMTQDGDQVQIDMSAFQSASSMRSIQNEVDETAFSTAAGAAFNYAVKGELDEEELQAIDELMTKLSGAVFSFYAQDLDQSFALLSGVDFDAKFLSGFSLDMRQSAVATYRAVETYQVSPGEADQSVDLAKISQSLYAIDTYFAKVLEEASSLPKNLAPGMLAMLLPTLFAEQLFSESSFFEPSLSEPSLPEPSLPEQPFADHSFSKNGLSEHLFSESSFLKINSQLQA